MTLDVINSYQEVKQAIERFISLGTIDLSSIHFTTQALEECKAHRGTFYQKDFNLYRCRFEADPAPLIQLFKPRGENRPTSMDITQCQAPNENWTSACHAISELRWYKLTLDTLHPFALYTALRGLMNHPLGELNLARCVFSSHRGNGVFPVVPVLCENLTVSHCRFDVPLPCTFPQTTRLYIGPMRLRNTENFMSSIESMVGVRYISFHQVSSETIRIILEHFRGSIQDIYLGYCDDLNGRALEPLATIMKQTRNDPIRLEIDACGGSSEDMLIFLKRIQFEPVELDISIFNDFDGTKDWPSMARWYNDRVKANREFLRYLHQPPPDQEGRLSLSRLPQEMRQELYLNFVGGPFVMDI